MNSRQFNFQITYLNSVESTNIYALELLQKENVQEGTVIVANLQSEGKGQMEKTWQSDEGKNLLMSLILKPNIGVEKRFQLSKIVALAIRNTLVRMSVKNVTIKWPNDILVNKQKIAGILIENSISGNKISTSIIGTGININQQHFSEFDRAATSLKNILKREIEVRYFMELLLENYQHFFNLPEEQINIQYYCNLYGYGCPIRMQDVEDKFTGVVLGVLPTGEIQVNKKGKLKKYELKQLKFLE